MSLRTQRVGRMLQKEISKILQRDLKEPVGFVTVMEVQVTEDLRQANVYYTVFGDEAEKIRTRKIIEAERSTINQQLGHNISLRYTPALHFIYDDTPEKASRIFELLDKIENDKKSESF